MEASHRPKQAQHFSTRRKVQNGNSRVHQDLPDSRGVGIVDRSIGHLPTHPHPSKLKEIPKVLLQVTGVPIHLPPIWTSHSPPGLYNDRKGSETNGPLKRTQNSPIPGRLADQVPVSGGSPSEHKAVVDLTQSLGWIINQEKSELKPTQVFFVHGLRIPPRFSPCKTHSREMAQTSGFDPTTRVKTCFDCKMFDVSNWVASLNGEMVPEGRLHRRPFHFHLKEHWRYPQSLDNLLPWTEAIAAHLDWWQNPSNVMKGADLHPKHHSIQLFTDASHEGWGAHLDQKFHEGSVVRSGKKATHICPRIEGGLPGPSRLQGPVPESNSVSCDVQLNSGSLHQQQGGTHSVEMCALLWKITTWGHHYLITLKARHVLGCLNVMADLLSRSNQVQSTEWSLHPQVFKQICQEWFTPHVDLFTTHLNHKLPLYVSPIPDPRAWDIDALNIN